MKTIVLLSASALLLFSCEKVKTYQCECVRIVDANTWNPQVTSVPIKGKEDDAKTQCSSMSYSYGWNDYQDCKIK